MDIQYKPSKPKKEKPAKAPKAPKAEKTVKFNSTVQKVKTSKPAKTPKPPKAEKAISFGKAAKVQTDKPMKVEKANKKPGILSKVDPKLILCGVLVLIAAVTAIMLTVVIPAVEEQGMQIQKIEITSQPDKLVYLVGEEADYDGLRVTVTRNNGETFVVRAADCQITGFKNDIAMESRIITVTYQGYSDIFSVKIMENEKPKPVLQSIRLDPMPKTEYKVGEWLDTSGAYIIREYVDGSTVTVNMLKTDVYGWDKVKGPGTYTLTVKYAENGVLCTFDYTITVTE